MFSVFSAPFTESLAYKADKRFGLARLYTESVPSSDHRFYSALLCHFTSSSHAFDTFSVRDARLIRDRQSDNFATLVELLTLHLESLKQDPLFANDQAPQSSVGQPLLAFGKWVASPLSPLAYAFGATASQNPGGSGTSPPRDRIREALNCARILARLVSVLMEARPQGEHHVDEVNLTTSLEERVLWTRSDFVRISDLQSQIASYADEAVGDQRAEEQFVIEEDDEAETSSSILKSPENPLIPKKDSAPVAPSTSPAAAGPTLAERLVALCIDFLFFPGFSLPHLPEDDDTGSPDDSRVHFAIWEKGVGSSVTLPGTSKEHIAHRVEFLRLLLVMLSKSVYVPPNAQQGFEDRALEFACTSLSRTVTLPLLCSLLNTACSPDQGGSWSLPGFGDQSETETRVAMRSLALQVLAVLLGWSPASQSGKSRRSSRPDLDRSQSATSVESSSAKNQFTHWISKIHRALDLSMVSSSIFALLRPAANLIVSVPFPMPTSNPTSNSQQGIYNRSPEVLTLLWHLIAANAKFKAHVLDDPVRAPALLSNLLSQTLLGKDKLPLHGLVRLNLFILQDISSHPGFARHIAAKDSASKCPLPAKFASLSKGASSASDILIAASYSLLTNRTLGSGGLGVHPVILITLANCAPFFVSLTIPSSTRLSLLLGQFSNAAFLLADEGHPRSLYFLLQAINLLLTYQAPSNRNVVYALLSKSKEVNRLRQFTLRRGIAEIRRKAGLAGVGAEVPSSSGLDIRTPLLSPGGDGSAEAESGGGELNSATAPSSTVSTGRSAKEEKSLLALKEEGKGQLEQKQGAAMTAGEDVVVVVDEEERRKGEGGAPATPSEKALGKARRISTSSAQSPRAITADQSRDQDQDQVQIQIQQQRTSPAKDQKAQLPGRRDDVADDWVNRLNDGELFEAASRIGKNGFVPSEEWVASWVEGLPLGPLTKLCQELVPSLESLCSTGGPATSENVEKAVAWLDEQDVSSLFPSPPTSNNSTATDPSLLLSPPQRPFQWTTQVEIWWWSFLWGSIYLAYSSISLFPPEGVRLFHLILPNSDQRQSSLSSSAPSTKMGNQVMERNNSSQGQSQGQST